MNCPHCTSKTSKVIDSRDSGNGIRRRRECLKCTVRYTTYEHPQMDILMVVKKNDSREQFNREKLRNSILLACIKRPLSAGIIDKTVRKIEAQLFQIGKLEVHTNVIGELVIQNLKAADRVSYIRYASVYRDFKDIETFQNEITELLEPSDEPKKKQGVQLDLIPQNS